MTPTPDRRTPGPRVWFGIWGAASLLALLFASQIWVDSQYSGRPIAWAEAMQFAFADWYVWAMLAPLVLWLTSRVPIRAGAWLRGALAHLALGAVLTLGKLGAETGIALVLTGESAPANALKLYFNLFIYGTLVGLFQALEHHRRLKEKEVTQKLLEERLAEAQLEVLRGQLRPHFLFNALNAISSLMRRDVEKADLMLERLATLLRKSLETSPGHESTLEEELQILDAYLSIEQARLGERLEVRLSVDAGSRNVMVPTLLLQPLVENAVRHGIAPRVTPGVLEVEALRENGRLVLEVRDNGPGFGAMDPEAAGVGLTSTRRRLEALYGDDQSLRLEERAGGGALVHIELPARVPGETAVEPAGQPVGEPVQP